MRKALLLLGVLVATGSAHGATGKLPTPVLTVHGGYASVAASGRSAVLASVRSSACDVRLLRLDRPSTPTRVQVPGVCPADTEAFVDDVWLGRTTIAAETYDSPSPHGEAFSIFRGPRPAGPLREWGDGWSWTDSEPPYGFGCARVVAAGGGVIAMARTPHRLGWDHGLEQEKPACPAGAATTIELSGAAAPRLSVEGSWAPLAVDGRRVLLAALDVNGSRTGELSLVDLAGKPLPAPAVAPAVAKTAFEGWLAPEGLVLDTRKGLVGPGWTVKGTGAVTVGEGRVLYTHGRDLHVRRIRTGLDRVLLRLPAGEADLAAGSFGVAIALTAGETVKLYRLPWRTIDRTLTR